MAIRQRSFALSYLLSFFQGFQSFWEVSDPRTETEEREGGGGGGGEEGGGKVIQTRGKNKGNVEEEELAHRQAGQRLVFETREENVRSENWHLEKES